MTFEIEKKDYIKSLPGQVEKVGDRWIVGYAKCLGCGKWLSIGAKEIDDSGKMHVSLYCSFCKVKRYYKLIGWDNKYL